MRPESTWEDSKERERERKERCEFETLEKRGENKALDLRALDLRAPPPFSPFLFCSLSSRLFTLPMTESVSVPDTVAGKTCFLSACLRKPVIRAVWSFGSFERSRSMRALSPSFACASSFLSFLIPRYSSASLTWLLLRNALD